MTATTLAKTFALTTVGTVLIGLGTVETAQAISFSDRAAFTAATGSLTNINFEGLASPNDFDRFETGLDVSGARFSASTATVPNAFLFVVDPGFSFAYDWGSGAVLATALQDSTISVALPAGVNAVGSDLMSFRQVPNGSGGTSTVFGGDFVINLSNGNSFTVPSFDRPNRAFFGFVSPNPITSISFRAVNGIPELDNFVFGQTVVEQGIPIPTPALLPGLIGLGAAMWRRRKETPDQADASSSKSGM